MGGRETMIVVAGIGRRRNCGAKPIVALAEGPAS
jgi:hypothetical protein